MEYERIRYYAKKLHRKMNYMKGTGKIKKGKSHDFHNSSNLKSKSL